jgi:Fe2+ transport system protein B
MGEHEHLESYKYSSTSHSSAKVLQNNKQFLLCGRTVIVLCIIVIAVDTFCGVEAGARQVRRARCARIGATMTCLASPYILQ